jgi:flagellar assembly protein FliH
LPQAETSTRKGASGRIEVFEYPVGPDAPAHSEWEGWGSEEEDVPQPVETPVHDTGSIENQMRAEFDKRLAEEKRRAFESGREQGVKEGRQAEHEAQAAVQNTSQAAAEKLRVEQAAHLIESFSQAQESYLKAVEPEVVKLAMAVAARILRREAQMDPLLLTGAVRVALGQLSGSTQVRLRVPEADLDLWSEAIALIPKLPVKPTVSAGEGMRLGDCIVETELGSVDLGIRSQLGEIERGFFDRVGGLESHSSKAQAAAPAESLVGAGQERGA